MQSLKAQPLSLFRIEFDELYARHLCRHSQRGINAIHLAALFGIWYAVYGLLHWAVGLDGVLAVPALSYLLILAPNVPLRVLVAMAFFLGVLIAAVLLLPAPWWAYLLMIPALAKIQSWSHRFYTATRDMTEFNRKYVKGRVLFVVLLIYEVPIVLNLLLCPRELPAVFGAERSSETSRPACSS